ncbi:MAG: hypothetical protein Q4G68_03430 [Planctomycetia bacterium]|nr:hypothetical protein [Planctomycetia bacterium]
MSDAIDTGPVSYEVCERYMELLGEISKAYTKGSPEELSIRYAAFAIFHLCHDQSSEAFFAARKRIKGSLSGLELLMFLSSGYEIPQEFNNSCISQLTSEISDIVHKINDVYRSENQDTCLNVSKGFQDDELASDNEGAESPRLRGMI